jgi:hypothetical protein
MERQSCRACFTAARQIRSELNRENTVFGWGANPFHAVLDAVEKLLSVGGEVITVSQQQREHMVKVTHCPPHAAYGTDSQPQFVRYQLPISATFDAHGVVRSTGISFSDYARMQTATPPAPHWRRIKPDWILDVEKFREVVTCVVERRAGLSFHQPGTHQQRIDCAQKRLNRLRGNKIGLLDALCEKYIAAKARGDNEAMKALAQKIEESDTVIAHLDRAAALVTAILFLSYRVGMNSVDVSAVLTVVKPPLVRQVCYRARKLAEQIFSGAPQPRQGLRNVRREAAYQSITQ